MVQNGKQEHIKDVQHYYFLRKCKLQPQSVDIDMQQLKLSSFAVGSAKWQPLCKIL